MKSQWGWHGAPTRKRLLQAYERCSFPKQLHAGCGAVVSTLMGSVASDLYLLYVASQAQPCQEQGRRACDDKETKLTFLEKTMREVLMVLAMVTAW